jgi:uncharacterized protein
MGYLFLASGRRAVDASSTVNSAAEIASAALIQEITMQQKDKLDLSHKNPLDFIVDYRRFLVIVITVVTVILAWHVPRLETDPTLRSGIDTDSPEYREYQEFVASFGNEEFVLFALKNPIGAGDPRVLTGLKRITERIGRIEKVEEVVSLANLRIFQKKGGLLGNFPLLQTRDGEPSLPDPATLATLKKALPLLDLLISGDLKTLGILVRVDEQSRLDLAACKEVLTAADAIVQENMAQGTDFRVIGPPLIRQAIVKYNVQTGIIFGILCMLIGTVVSAYMFKSARVTAITNFILGLCILWVLGLMAVMGIPLNSTTALSFGFIPITTVEIVIHMVVRYHQFHEVTREKIGAIKQTVRWLTRPCLICSATTAVGFGTLMVSSIPMVRQLGFIMSVGIMISFSLAMILTPAFFIRLKTLDTPEEGGLLRDWLGKLLDTIEDLIFRRYRLFVYAGIILTALLFAAAPSIRSDSQILRMLSDSTREVKDIGFVEHNLTPVQTLELVLDAPENAFKKPEVWEKVRELEDRIKAIPEVVTTDSFLSVLQYMNGLVGEDSPKNREALFTNPDLIPQLFVVTSFSPEGERMLRRYLTTGFDRCHIGIRIKNSPDVPLAKTLAQIRSVAADTMKGIARTRVTGELTVIDDQTSSLIRDQIRSMFLAAAIISVLMMIQLGSALLGLICLVPNIPPVAAVFGIMGWFEIPLDSVTVFAATVAIGLAVDNTIHFLTQLKREITLHPNEPVEKGVRVAYRLTAKQIASWSTVTMFGFLALAVSPFRPVVFFGILGCASIVLGLYGDLIFMQSLILWSSSIRNTIKKLCAKESAAGGMEADKGESVVVE